MTDGDWQDEDLPLAVRRRIDRECLAFEDAWKSGGSPAIEDFLPAIPEAERAIFFRELLLVDIAYRRQRGEAPAAAEFEARFPDRCRLIAAALAQGSLCGERNTRAAAVAEEASWATSGGTDNPAELLAPGHRLGHYEICSLLGQGGMGSVYLAARSGTGRRRGDQGAAAGRVAGDHRRPVEEAAQRREVEPPVDRSRPLPGPRRGRLALCSHGFRRRPVTRRRCWIRERALDYRRSAELIGGVARAVHYAHLRGFVHRDLKPSNILLDREGRPQVTDFGLALHESAQRGRSGDYSGTPAYMAPEQFRGDAHRLDGRADIWALGAILYRLLTGQRAFPGDTREEIKDEVLSREPKPPRQIDDRVPESLERICLRCLAKDVTGRYPTAHDLARDLDRWLHPQRPRLLWGLAAAVMVAALLPLAMFSIHPASSSQNPPEIPPQSGPVRGDDLALQPVQPIVVGVRSRQRIGFPSTPQTIFDSGSPHLLIPEKQALSGAVNITRIVFLS